MKIKNLKKRKLKVRSLVRIVVRNRICLNNQISLKRLQYEDIKLRKQQKTGNCKNICIYFNKGVQQFKNLKKENQKSEA